MESKEIKVEDEIIINLNDSSNAKEFPFENIIHKREFNQAIYQINNRIERSKLTEKIRYNDTISILGSRGSGKTSFLMSLLKFYKEDFELKKKVEVLDIIDPTLIEEKGHIFLTILSLIKEKVENKLDISNCKPGDFSYLQKNDWKEKLRKIANGLPSIDGVGLGLDHTNWQDAEFIMDRGLKSVKAAANLENNFNDLVGFALKVLSKEVFILTLDDIDVDFKKGWPVLETIRKYLTSPQIIVLLSGDLKLYSKAIRKQQWGNFGKALLINEAEKSNKMNEYNDLVTEMEGQYMQKIMKPENRIRLTSLLEKDESPFITIYISSAYNRSKSSKILLNEYYDIILKQFGISNRFQAEIYRTFLLALPVRTQFQFLIESQKVLSDKSEILKGVDNIVDPFLSDLFEKEVDIEIASNTPKYINVVILKLLIKEQILAEAYQLQPNTSDISLNSSLMALSFLFSQKVVGNPYLIFDYFIKIGYIRNLLPSLGYDENTNKTKNSILSPSIEGMCNHTGLLQDKVLKDVVGNVTAYVLSIPNNDDKQTGIIHLLATSQKDKNNTVGRIDYEFKNKDSLQQIVGYIPITISQHLTKNNSILSYSVYTLIGTIGEILRKIDQKDLNRGLAELSQFRTYPMVSFDRNQVSQNEIFVFDDITINDDDSKKILTTMLEEWHGKFPNCIISPHLLGKISTRIFYAFNSIDKSNIDTKLGLAMHRRIIALLNAILVEDIKENYSDCKGINLNNPISVDDIFINNLREATRLANNKKLGFSKWLVSCPLFLFYLEKSLLMNELFIDFILTPNNHINVVKEKDIYNILNRIDVNRSKRNSDNSLPKFSGAKGKANTTIEILKPIIAYSDFMLSPLEKVKKICSEYFAPNIISPSISSLRSHIRENNIKW